MAIVCFSQVNQLHSRGSSKLPSKTFVYMTDSKSRICGIIVLLPSSTLKHTVPLSSNVETLPTGYKLISITACLKISSKYLEVVRKWNTTEELKWYIYDCQPQDIIKIPRDR
jgi:hypothetical protein